MKKLVAALFSVLCACSSHRVLEESDFESAPESKKPVVTELTAINNVKVENNYTTMRLNGLIFKGYLSISKQHFLRASEISEKMLSKIPDVKKRMIETKFTVFLINAGTSLTDHPEYAEWKGKTFHQYTQGQRSKDDVRGITEQFLCAVDETTLYDPVYNVMVHEFAHGIMFNMVREDLDDIRKAYNHALLNHLFSQRDYVMENSWEYWAVLTEAWFRPKAALDNLESRWAKKIKPGSTRLMVRSDVEKRDPQAAQILERFYGDVVISYDQQ